MKIEYYHGNLFDLESDDTVFAHCIAADFGMYGGIARQFVEKYNMKNKLIEAYPNLDFDSRVSRCGTAIKIDNTYNLITKPVTASLPPFHYFMESLKSLKAQMLHNHEIHLAIPKLGCGIDMMDWDTVLAALQTIFENTNITITVAVLKEN